MIPLTQNLIIYVLWCENIILIGISDLAFFFSGIQNEIFPSQLISLDVIQNFTGVHNLIYHQCH